MLYHVPGIFSAMHSSIVDEGTMVVYTWVRSRNVWHRTDPGINPGICEASDPNQEQIIRQLGFLRPKVQAEGPEKYNMGTFTRNIV